MFADCSGEELPYGWEQCYDPVVGYFYVNHITHTNQLEDPRHQWHQLQEAMLKEYLVLAQEELSAKQEIYDVKQQRLSLALENYYQLQTTIAELNNCHSDSSLCSTFSNSSVTKYDPDLLRVDVALARERVERLRQELRQIRKEMHYKEEGIKTLSQVDRQFCDQNTFYTLEETRAILEELQNIQKSLRIGKKEKEELIMNVLNLTSDLSSLHLISSDDRNVCTVKEKCSTFSQTEMSGEYGHLGVRLAEMANLRLHYEEMRKFIHQVQQELADLENLTPPEEMESEKDRLVLIQEKENLLQELQNRIEKENGHEEVTLIQSEISKLEEDLSNAIEVSNRVIADRLILHEKKNNLLEQLRDAIRQTTYIESRLKSLSASTLSASLSSSLGSLGTSSSKGSLSSLSFTDIYGFPPTSLDPSVEDLHKQVEQVIHNNVNLEGTLEDFSSSLPLRPSLSSCSSLSSVSSSRSPCDLALESSHSDGQQKDGLSNTQEQFQELNLTSFSPGCPRMDALTSSVAIQQTNLPLQHENRFHSLLEKCISPNYKQPREPSKESNKLVHDMADNLGSSNNKGIYAVPSNESVAGDSGVFEASIKRPERGELKIHKSDIEGAQVQVTLRYASEEGILHVRIEKARNLMSLFVPNNRKIFIKAGLQPVLSNTLQESTKLLDNVHKPIIAENFKFSINLSKLYTKTLQISVCCMASSGETECLGSVQISLADFDPSLILTKWYNVLTFHVLQLETQRERNHEVPSTREKEEIGLDETANTGISNLSGRNSSASTSARTSIQDSDVVKCGELANGQHDSLEGADRREEHYCGEESGKDLNVREFQILQTTRCGEHQKCISERLSHQVELCDKETNTECVFLPLQNKQKQIEDSVRTSVIKRSQTFTPNVDFKKHHYVCKLNRSYSDSSVPLYRKRVMFQQQPVKKNVIVVRAKHHYSSFTELKTINLQTSLDLVLDLQASHRRLNFLQHELSRLKEMKQQLQDAKLSSSCTVPSTLEAKKQIKCPRIKETKDKTEEKVKENLKQAKREIYKLKRNRNNHPDVSSFREKMAFFTRSNVIPFTPTNEGIESVIPQNNYLCPNTTLLSAEAIIQRSKSDNVRTRQYVVDPDYGVVV
ncbi:protein kibra-like isoform X2 [Tachypleus tridentatus]